MCYPFVNITTESVVIRSFTVLSAHVSSCTIQVLNKLPCAADISRHQDMFDSTKTMSKGQLGPNPMHTWKAGRDVSTLVQLLIYLALILGNSEGLRSVVVIYLTLGYIRLTLISASVKNDFLVLVYDFFLNRTRTECLKDASVI